MVATSPRSGPVGGPPQAEHRKQRYREQAVRSYLSPDERREYLTLVAELGALDEDIEHARAAARRATAGFGLDLRAHPEPAHAVVHGEQVGLADGGEIVVRPIEPGDAHDLAVGVQHLSALSRFRRFRAPIDHLSPARLTELTEIDHESHEAIVAFETATGEGIGVARYVRAPDDPAQAEFTCAVLDRWQRRGVGTALVERLAARARAVGIERFTALIVVGNEPARRLVARVADVVSEHPAGGTVEISGRSRGARS
jgi:RimJ/RimL family protein N-acetyltransferase